MIEQHKNLISWCKKIFNISNYSLLWISFLKGVLVGLLIYHFIIIQMKIIAGVDEVGRGSLIGPVYAAAVILNKKIDKKLLKDSKK